MTSLWTSEEVAQALGVISRSWEATGISIDTRTLKPGDLYIALRGDVHDGHAFVEQAFLKGAVAAIVDCAIEKCATYPQIVVKDTLKALNQLASFARQRTKAILIAVTGSVGKTTTKEMLNHTLQKFAPTFASPASYNNHWGVPLSLASMPRETIYGVFEVGMNHRGEIAPLVALIQPHMSVVTTVAEAHIGLMASRMEIAEEKAEIFSSLPSAALGVIHQDIPEFDIIRKYAFRQGISKIIGFGKSPESDIQLLDYKTDSSASKGQVTILLRGNKISYSLSQPGEHIALNSLIVLSVGEALGLDQKKLIAQLETFSALAGRGKRHMISLKGGEVLLIDNAYNANLTSMQAGLAVFGNIPVQKERHRFVVLGEMLELGDQAQEHHHQLMQEVRKYSIHKVFVAGSSVISDALQNVIPEENIGGYAQDAETLIPQIDKILQPGDVIFVKGSKGSRVSKIVDYFLNKTNLIS